jgi:hypothetical protein
MHSGNNPCPVTPRLKLDGLNVEFSAALAWLEEEKRTMKVSNVAKA